MLGPQRDPPEHSSSGSTEPKPISLHTTILPNQTHDDDAPPSPACIVDLSTIHTPALAGTLRGCLPLLLPLPPGPGLLRTRSVRSTPPLHSHGCCSGPHHLPLSARGASRLDSMTRVFPSIFPLSYQSCTSEMNILSLRPLPESP